MFIGIWIYLFYNGIYLVKILMVKNLRDIFLEVVNILFVVGYIFNIFISFVK